MRRDAAALPRGSPRQLNEVVGQETHDTIGPILSGTLSDVRPRSHPTFNGSTIPVELDVVLLVRA